MRTRLARWMGLAVLWLAAGALRGQQATLVGDAHVSSAQPTVNAGSLSNLNVGGGYTALLQFDLGVLPAGTTSAQVTRATLRVYCNRADAVGVVTVQPVLGAWSELTVTYATEPGLGAAVQTAQVSAAGTYVTFDVTGTVQGWVSAPATNLGLALTAASAVVQFDSKENDQTGHAPELEVVLASGTGTAGATGATGATGAIGPAGPAGPQGLPGLIGPVGPIGLTGATGATGQQGPTGLAGATGATGATGAAGPAGADSSVSLGYEGTYSSTTNYGLGDIVSFTGSSWLSLVASNHGNTPGLTVGSWGLLASVGAAGATGAAGSAGATGPQGPVGIGAQGPVGATGATGATGAAGLPGLVYRGTYSSVTNYALGDVVVFAGSSYASLVAGNAGQTPGLSPAYWGLLTAQGPVGPVGATGLQGPTGATGVVGSVGPPGEQGPQGLQGIAGTAGAQGIPGATGATGLQGPMGPEGPAGPVGLSFKGAYSSGSNYALGDGVSWEGAGWVSLQDSNHGNTPDASPGAWAMFAAAGVDGAAGATGATGATGPTGSNGLQGLVGPVGPAGATGAAGLPGLMYQGAYSSTTNYALGDVVVFGGASYVSLVAGNAGQTPGLSPAYWGVLTSMGPQGPVGLTGATGPQGATGAQGLGGAAGPAGPQGATGTQGPAGAQGLTGVTGAVGVTGAAGPQGIAGMAGAQGIPGATGATGLQGPMGPEGPAGPVGLSFKGAYNSVTNYALGDGVMWQGAGWVSLQDANHGNTPDASPGAWEMFAAAGLNGAAGATGATGATGPAGANGLSGPPGPAGATGATGAAGSPGLVYQGAYSSGANYSLGDVVVFGGASYVSLVAANAGQTPGLSPTYWGVLTSVGSPGPVGLTGATGPQGVAGPAGATGPAGAQGVQGGAGIQGPAGAQGLTGAVGPVGATGAAGPQGIAGTAGAQGIPGATGATGLQGPIGLTGAAGPVGLSFKGAYSSGSNYALGDGVLWQGSGWVSLEDANHGNTPDQSPAAWAMFAAQGGAGATGATGAQGVAGPAGPQGAAGAVGATGATGAMGPAGLNFVGTYASGTSYGVGDAVSYGGASYVSLAAGNLGQTPGLSPAYWALLAAQGATGAAGPMGATGATGPAGAVGTPGATGAQGAPVNFAGGWLIGTSYAVGDAVSYGGSSYIAMVANVGREPDVSPSYWGLLAASGAQGPVGPAGAMGLQGPTGFPGATGATGATGTQGVAGPAGAMGPAGPVGPAGPAGATGAAGPAGLVWQGAYASGVNYNVGDAVSYGGASYVSLVTGNAGQTPSASPSSWALLAAAGTNGLTGATGATGSIGPAGPMGATGAAGTNGSNGVNGTPGLVWQGAWASSTSYAANDAVSYGGASYVSLMAGNLGQLPGSSPSSWTLLAAAGSAGANGAVGVTGATGAPGATGPQGPAGATGATGAAGAVGMNYRGVWNSGLNYLANDAVTFQGSTYLAQMAGTDLQPDANPAAWQVIAQAGGAGPTGAAGAAATVTVGTVTTLSAGAQATVSNSGTAQAAVLNFGIPQGVQGTAGSGGSGGSAVSNGFASMYHTVSYATTYYSINSPTASATESASVMTWIPNACTLTGLTAYSQQSNMITVSVRVVIPTPAAAVMSCSVATNSSCSATGSVAIAAGSFLDLEIDNPSGTPTGVWTSVTCQ